MRTLALLLLLAALPGCMVLIVVDESTRPAAAPTAATALADAVAGAVSDGLGRDSTLAPRLTPLP